MISLVVVVPDEATDVGLEVARQIIVLQQDAVLERLVPAFDLALGLRMVGCSIEANGPEFDGMQDYGAHLVVDALLDAMVNMDLSRKAIFVAFHDVIPGTTYVKPGESWSLELRRAFDRTMEEVRAIIEERRASPRSDFISDLVNARDQGEDRKSVV